MTFDIIPWFLHSIYVTIFSRYMLSMLFLEIIFFLCYCLNPSYVMTFDIIPVKLSFFMSPSKALVCNDIRRYSHFFLHFRMGQRITSTLGRAQKKKLELRRRTLSMLIFLGVENLVDVSHLQPSMLIFSMLIPHPGKVGRILIWRYTEGYNPD